MDRVVVAWSGGKDAAFALSRLRSTSVEVVELMTTVDERYDRSTMHGVRRSVYERQASALGLPMNPVVLPSEPTNETYEATMAEEVARYRERGVDRIVFGDLFLEDVRSYRETQLAGTGLEGAWPLWGLDTAELARTVIDAGFRATVVVVDGGRLDASFAGRAFDREFLDDLPESVDPCGEHGEFHTFVRDGPTFDAPVPVRTAETVTRSVGGTDYHYVDLEPC